MSLEFCAGPFITFGCIVLRFELRLLSWWSSAYKLKALLYFAKQDVVKWGREYAKKKETKKTENIKVKVAWCVEADIKYTLTVLVILQPRCITMMLYFKWQNLLVSCVGSELFKSVIARGICASLWFFFPPCASELWQQFFYSSLINKLFS